MSSELRSLRIQLRVTQVCAVLAVVTAAVALHIGHRPPSELNVGNVHVAPDGVRVGPHALSRLGLTVVGPQPTRPSNLVAYATGESAFLAIGGGGASLVQSVDVNSRKTIIAARGQTTVELRIDTDTGAVTLARSVLGAEDKAVVTELAAPLR